jgi:hypothetical protein
MGRLHSLALRSATAERERGVYRELRAMSATTFVASLCKGYPARRILMGRDLASRADRVFQFGVLRE